jgi:hypothetical protein
MGLDFRAELIDSVDSSLAPRLQVFFSALSEVPLLFAVSMQFDPRILRPIRIINGCLSLAMCILFYILVFFVLPKRGSDSEADLRFVSYLFDAVDAFVAIAATIRALGEDQPQERRFFFVAAIFFWADTILPAIHNRLLIRYDFVWLDLFISTPSLILLVLIYREPLHFVRLPRPTRQTIRIIRSLSPIFLCLSLMLLGILVSRIHFYIGAGAFVIWYVECPHAEPGN